MLYTDQNNTDDVEKEAVSIDSPADTATDIFARGEIAEESPPPDEGKAHEDSQGDPATNSSAAEDLASNLPVVVPRDQAKRSFCETAVERCLPDALDWVKSDREKRVATYRLLENVAKARVHPEFDLVELCQTLGYPCQNPDHKNKSLVILKALTWKAGEEMSDKTASKYGLVVEWLVKQCPDLAAIVQFLAEHGGIQGVDEMRSRTLPPSANDGRRRSGSGAGERSETQPEKLFGVPPDLPDKTTITAVREGGKWQYQSTVIDVPTEVEAQ